jgi:hypothetical protein
MTPNDPLITHNDPSLRLLVCDNLTGQLVPTLQTVGKFCQPGSHGLDRGKVLPVSFPTLQTVGNFCQSGSRGPDRGKVLPVRVDLVSRCREGAQLAFDLPTVNSAQCQWQ